MLERIDHIGIAVDDIDRALTYYCDALGFSVAHRETVPDQGVEGVLLDVGDGHVEVLASLGPDTTIGRFLEKNGPGLHHVAYQVTDIDAELERLRAAGVRLIDHTARPGIRGSRVAFLNPRSSIGVLTELVEPHTVTSPRSLSGPTPRTRPLAGG